MSLKSNTRLVYSTADSGKCPVCGWPQRNCQCSTRRAASEPVPTRVVAKLRMEKKGRGGVELQGDVRDRVRDILIKRGFVVKG